MRNLWDDKEADKFSSDDLNLRVYSSRLLGQNPALVLHGGGNTSMKGIHKNIFSEPVETLFIKGSGWDLISIQKEGFAPVRLNQLRKLAELSSLSDSEMVREQKLATLNPSAPNPSVEAILHALIPNKFVDHTHADAVLSVTNTPNGKKKINEIYGSDILIVPYVMPGFILAKKVSSLTKNIDWEKLKGMILMNHGVFSFGDSAKESYTRMISIVSKAENYLKKKNAWKKYAKHKNNPDPLALSKIRCFASRMTGGAVIAKLNSSPEACGFSKLKNSKSLSRSGTLTPDHVIRTKPFAWIIEKDLEKSSESFIKKYENYFSKNNNNGLSKLDNGPKWALWPNVGVLSFGRTNKDANIVKDINNHTIRAMQESESLHKWKPLPENKLFEIEYWELEQAKLKNEKIKLPFQGQIALVTGAASGIGLSCAKSLLDHGCVVAGIDKNPNILSTYEENKNFSGFKCDVTNSSQVKSTIKKIVLKYGGLDKLISNAGVFPESINLASIPEKKWKQDLESNLTSHHHILKHSIPFLKNGIDSAVVFVGTRNVGAPGPGAGTYSIAKSGLTQMARLAAIELAPLNIRVNIVHPDCVYDTEIWTEKVLNERSKQYGITIEEYISRNLLKKPVSSKNVAEAVRFLIGESSSKTTGAQIPVDGGNDRII